MTTIFYRALDRRYRGPYQGVDFRPYLPRQKPDGTWEPGEWTPAVEGELRLGMQGNGWFASDGPGFVGWVNERNYEVEADGEMVVEEGREIAARRIRLLRPLRFTSHDALMFTSFCLSKALYLDAVNLRVEHAIYQMYEINRERPYSSEMVQLARHAARYALEAIGQKYPERPELVKDVRLSMWEDLRYRMYHWDDLMKEISRKAELGRVGVGERRETGRQGEAWSA